MIVWTPLVLSVLFACVLYFCTCTCSAQLSMFHMERRSIIIIIIIIIISLQKKWPIIYTGTLSVPHEGSLRQVSPMKVAVHCRSLRLPYSLRAKGVWSGQIPFLSGS